MSSLQYYNYPSVGTTNNQLYSYSQAVRVGNIIKTSGQGGWDGEGKIEPADLKHQIEQAFKNVEKTLQDAGLNGWSDVYSVRSYHITLVDSFDIMVELFRRYMPAHQPIWTCVRVQELGLPGMLVEIEVEATVGSE